MSLSMEQLLNAHEQDTIIAQPGEPIVNITAQDARRKVGRYVGEQISLLMHPIDPALIYSEGKLVWRVLIEIATPMQGHIGFVGALDVDARTSEFILPANFVEEIEANARTLLKRSPHPTEV